MMPYITIRWSDCTYILLEWVLVRWCNGNQMPVHPSQSQEKADQSLHTSSSLYQFETAPSWELCILVTWLSASDLRIKTLIRWLCMKQGVLTGQFCFQCKKERIQHVDLRKSLSTIIKVVNISTTQCNGGGDHLQRALGVLVPEWQLHLLPDWQGQLSRPQCYEVKEGGNLSRRSVKQGARRD